MGTLNDVILAATGGPTVNDGLRAYYNAEGVPYGALADMERAFLRIQMPAATGTTSDLWMQYLIGTQGFTGTLNDMQYQYWATIAGVTAPVNSVPPAITGNPQSGSKLTCSTGTWSEADYYTFRWFDDGTPIIGETSNQLTLNSGYLGATITCSVTAGNVKGTATAMSNSVVVIP